MYLKSILKGSFLCVQTFQPITVVSNKDNKSFQFSNVPHIGFMWYLDLEKIVRFKLLNLFIYLFHVRLLHNLIHACVTLRYIMTHSCIWISFQSSLSITACFRSLVLSSRFLSFVQVSSSISSLHRIRGIFVSSLYAVIFN